MRKFKIPHVPSINKARKAKIIKALPGTIAIVVLLAVVAVTFFHTTDGFTTIVEVEPASIVVEKDYMSFSAYTLKHEKVIKPNNYNGGIYYLANDAQRINPGDPLVHVYENDVDKNTLALSKELDRCISILEKSIGDGVFTLGESKEVKQNLSSLYIDMMRASLNGDGSVITVQADNLLTLLNQIEMFSGDGEQLKKALDNYRKDREKLKEEYSGAYETINANEGGYFYRDVDGYESIFSSENIGELTYESFFEMTQKDPLDEACVGKMLLDYRWYLVIPTVKGISDSFNIGEAYDISLPDSGNRTLKMSLNNVIYDSTGARSLMVFMCGIVDGSFNLLREQQVNITHKNIIGYRVPASAVCEIGGNTGVYILSDGMASFRKVVILYEGDGYYIVSSENGTQGDYYRYLKLNDNIIADCRNMYEGKVIG
jgi:hypothetical protein